jgi:branched-chain amino acid transport system permease protein
VTYTAEAPFSRRLPPLLNDLYLQFLPSTVGGLMIGAIYALVALGYTMVYGVLRLINFAHSEIFMIGTFAALFLIISVGVTAPLTGVVLFGFLLLLMVFARSSPTGRYGAAALRGWPP